MDILLPMSLQQLNHLDILRRVERREITQTVAANLLKVTDRTVRRQLEQLVEEGPGFLQHGLKGQVSNNRIPVKEEKRIEKLLRTKYPDFGPTFAAEKLLEKHGVSRDPKTIQRIQIASGLYRPRRSKKKKPYHFFRVRRSIFGELVQFDGSYHDWFEGRSGIEEACLLLAVDDATGDIVHAAFAPHEGVLPVMGFWLEYAGINGIPKAIYLDRFSTYSMNVKLAAENPDTLTQFQRAGKEAGMDIIHAYSPQAKGRVENKFGTLQDRLVKEMRLADICSIEDANRFLREFFITDYNKRFGKSARKSGDLHRIPSRSELEDILPHIFCRREKRVIQNDFTVSFKASWFQLLPTPRLALRTREDVQVHELPDETIRLFVRGKQVNFHLLPEKSNKGRKRAFAQTLTV